jgi:hypothetical protein
VCSTGTCEIFTGTGVRERGASVDQPKQGFDMSKLGMGDKLVLGGAALYFIWVFMPVWYKFTNPFASILGSVGSLSINGFRGFLIISWLASIVAIGEIVLVKLMGNTSMTLPAPRGMVHLIVAGAALLFTVLGLLAKPTGFGISWGIFVALVFALVWTWGAYQLYSAGTTATPPASGGPDTMS